MVQAFRRDGSIYEAARIPLRGLDPGASYDVMELDGPGVTATASPKATRWSGAELLDRGVAVAIPARPGAAVITYARVP